MTKSGLLSLGLLALAQSCSILHAKPVDVTLASGDVLRVEAVTPNILRVRLAADGRFQRSLMERYGIVKSEWPTGDFKTRSEGGSVIVETTAGSLSVRAADGQMQLRGHGYRLWTQYRGNFGYHGQGAWEQTEGPIPLLLSTGGWGLFVNTTWVHYYSAPHRPSAESSPTFPCP